MSAVDMFVVLGEITLISLGLIIFFVVLFLAIIGALLLMGAIMDRVGL